MREELQTTCFDSALGYVHIQMRDRAARAPRFHRRDGTPRGGGERAVAIDQNGAISLSRKQWIVLTGAATVAFWIALGILERSLPSGTPGILEFELVRNGDRAARFLSEWGAGGRDTVRLSLIVDYGFMLSYGAFVTLAGLATRDFGREQGRHALAAAGRVVPWFAVGAAIFDAGENAFLLLTVGGSGGSVAPVLATVCASVKWVLIVIAVGYLIWGLGARLLYARRSGVRQGGSAEPPAG
jgi:hypothetical protein